MAEATSYLYDGLFLMNPAAISGDLAGGLAKVREVLERYNAEIVSLRKWDERKLAYPVKGQKRGVYLLALFRVAGDQITRIERECNLSDEVLRVLVTRADHLGETEINAEVEAGKTTEAEAKLREGGEGASAQPVEAGSGSSE